MKLKVTKKYKESFDYIVDMYEKGEVDSSIIESASNGIIKPANSNLEFEYSEDEFTSIKSDDDLIKNFGKESKVDSTKEWNQFVDLIKSYTQNKYRFIKINYLEKGNKNDRDWTNQDLIFNFTNNFLSHLDTYIDASNIKKVESEIDYIYSALIRIQDEENQKQLVKLFFKLEKDHLVPLTTRESLLPNNYLERELEENEIEPTLSKTISKEVTMLIGEVNSMVNNDLKSEYFVPTDIKKTNINYKIINFEILGFYCIEMKMDSYILRINSQPLLRFDIDSSHKLNVYCINCGYTQLIKNDKFLMDDDYNSKSILWNKLEENDRDIIYSKSIFSKHLKKINCNKLETRRESCTKIRCDSQLLDFNGIKKCKNCPYPEIMMEDENGKIKLTKNMTFLRDKLRFISSDEYETCKKCKRHFSLGSLENGLCKFCSSIENTTFINKTSEIKKGRKLYKKYKRVLPFYIRIFYFFSAKLCFEEADIIAFKIGNRSFYYQKLEKNKGFTKKLIRSE